MRLLLISLFLMAGGAQASSLEIAAESPCYATGNFVQCTPANGLFLDTGRSLRLGTSSNSVNYVELVAPDGMAGNVTLTFPSTSGSIGKVLSNVDGTGVLDWADAGISTAALTSVQRLTPSKQAVDLVCESNVTLSGVQTCDGQPTSNAVGVLLIAQTDPTENGVWGNDDFSAWARRSDMAGISDVPGSLVSVTEQGGGTVYQDTLWFGESDGGSTANYKQVAIPTKSNEQDLGTLVWSAVSAPSGTIAKKYRWTQVGSVVSAWFKITASVAGTTVTAVDFPLPADMPLPVMWTSQPASTALTFGTGQIAGGASPTGGVAGDSKLYLDGGSAARVTIEAATSATGTFVWGYLSYSI